MLEKIVTELIELTHTFHNCMNNVLHHARFNTVYRTQKGGQILLTMGYNQ